MTKADHIEGHSCLLETQHGADEEMQPISDEEVDTVRIGTADEGFEQEITTASASRPQIHRVYQAKAATYKPRSRSQIDSIIIHTPEGYEGGTLSVLQQGRAGFDWYLPPSGNLYKCNAFGKYVAWQAGYWPYNLRSIGIEQWDFAANMGNAGDAHYRRLAELVAWLTQLLDIPVRHADYGQPGLIAHAQVTPRQRSDPGKDFDWDKLIRFTNEARGKGSGGGRKPDNPPVQSEVVWRVIAGAFSDAAGARRRAREVEASGFGVPWIYQSGSYRRVQVSSWSDQRDADAVVEALKSKGIEAYSLAEKSGDSGKA